ncbi:MAG: hypothetical protein ACRDQ5_10500 [Sciscionella sp.]
MPWFESAHSEAIEASEPAHLTATAGAGAVRTVWLEPAGEAEARVYSRAGFHAAGHKPHISLEPAS